MSIRYTLFLINPDFKNQIDTKLIEEIVANEWILDIVYDEIELEEQQTKDLVKKIVSNIKNGVISELNPDQQYLVGYVLVAIMNKIGDSKVFEDCGEGLRYEFGFSKDNLLSYFILGQNSLTEFKDKNVQIRDSFWLKITKEWEFPIISYIKLDEIKKILASIKENTILVPILLELANYNFPGFDTKQLTGHLNLSIGDVKELTKAYEEDNETYKKYKSSDRSMYDALYLF